MSHRETRPLSRRRRRPLAISLLFAVCLLLALALLSPPCVPESPPRVSGRPGPLVLLPELSIEEGSDAAHRVAAPAAAGRAGRPRPPEPQRDATRPVPATGTPSPGHTAPVPVPERAGTDSGPVVPLRPPAVSSPCFRLVRMVPPEYPPLAGSLPDTVHVKVAFFVAPAGTVAAAYTLENDGPPAFATVVLAAVRRWRYAPVPQECAAPDGFWQPLRVTFPPLLRIPGGQ